MSTQTIKPTSNSVASIKEISENYLERWFDELQSGKVPTVDATMLVQLRPDLNEFTRLLFSALTASSRIDLSSDEWSEMYEFIADWASRYDELGFAPVEIAELVLSAKDPLFDMWNSGRFEGNEIEGGWRSLARVIDRLAIYSMEVLHANREATIRRQQAEMLELSTPVIKLWDGIIAVPLIGTLDSERAQTVMEALLTATVEHNADTAIIDITGVPTVDTLVAQHILKTVSAARLMGAECIISGIRPAIAQTIVNLGIDISTVATKATLAEAMKMAFVRAGLRVHNRSERGE